MSKINLTLLLLFSLLVVSSMMGIPSASALDQPPTGLTVYLPMISNPEQVSVPTTPAPTPTPNTTPTPSGQGEIDPALLFIETFDGDNATLKRFASEEWDLTIHQRDNDRLYEMEAMPADHGPNCEAPPSTHTITAFEDNLYVCKSHMMTANYGVSDNGGYGLVFFTPNRVIDTTGDFFIQFDMSTFRVNPARNWVDLWIVPFDQNLQLAIHNFDPDLQGAPLQAVQVRLNVENYFTVTIHDHGQETKLKIDDYTQYHNVLEMSKKTRSTFSFGVQNGRLKIGMPEHDIWWHDQPAPAIFSQPEWKESAIQFGHHSYTPDKQCGMSFFQSMCEQHGADTFHWDNIMAYPAKPFDLVQGSPRLITPSAATQTFTPEKPAPAGSHLRFAGIGDNIEVSFNNGVTWQPAIEQAHSKTEDNPHFRSYWMPIPTGTTKVKFRGANWWGGQFEWAARDISIWAKIDSSVASNRAADVELTAAEQAVFHALISGERDPNSFVCDIPQA
jgi:hypothetical protein